jgi:hypothetical protein
MADADSSPSPARSRLPSPGCLLVVTLILSLVSVCGWFGWRARQQSKLIRFFEQLGGHVETQPAQPAWLHDVVESALGARHAAGLIDITVLDFSHTPFSDADLRNVAGLSCLKSLNLELGANAPR